MTAPPDELLRFLRDGRQLEFDVERSPIGEIVLKRIENLSTSVLGVFPGCQLIVDDPYEWLDGCYEVEVMDLVEESEHYDPQGLLCWITRFERFGMVDIEHGTIRVFPHADWNAIVENPATYLDEMWAGKDVLSEVVLPWLHLPFRIDDSDVVLSPYPDVCPVHQQPLVVETLTRHPLFEVMQRREANDYLDGYLERFPCAGVPVGDSESRFCRACHVAENAWVDQTADAIEPLEAWPNEHGWVKCPGCGWRFPSDWRQVFRDGIHLPCGQKVRVVV